jgi:hypothetical protein
MSISSKYRRSHCNLRSHHSRRSGVERRSVRICKHGSLHASPRSLDASCRSLRASPRSLHAYHRSLHASHHLRSRSLGLRSHGRSLRSRRTHGPVLGLGRAGVLSSIFFVKDIEGRQANVGELLFTKKEFVTL